MKERHSNTGKEAGERTRLQRVGSWCRRKAVVLIPVAMVIYGGVLLAQPPSVADLSEENRAMAPTLLSDWQKGEVIVLLRHLERCDRADAPCLDGKESGITERAVEHGHALGQRFNRLGLENADISNSPLARTVQTSEIVFSRVEHDQGWLYECDEEMLESVMQRKEQGRNLILVTHSGCMQALQMELGYDDDTPGYGTALFVSARHGSDEPELLGFLDMEDWEMTLGF